MSQGLFRHQSLWSIEKTSTVLAHNIIVTVITTVMAFYRTGLLDGDTGPRPPPGALTPGHCDQCRPGHLGT